MFESEQEKQKELFEEFHKSNGKLGFIKDKTKFLQGKYFILQFSTEKLVFALIGIIIFVILIFCAGVECGKKASFSISRKKTALQTKVVKKTAVYRPAFIYTVRIATYLNKNAADAIIDKLKKKGFPAYLALSGNAYMICIGDYTNKKQAEAVLSSIKNEYRDSHIKTTKR